MHFAVCPRKLALLRSHPNSNMTVLMLGRHLELGHHRAEFLRSNGIEVVFPESKRAAFAAIRAGDFDVVVLSYTLSDKTAKELVDLMDQVCPDCPIVSLTENRWHDPVLRPDRIVLATDTPQSLLEAIKSVQHRKPPAGRIKSS
jgi:DNA-binding NarL/FixJ family response regulator